MTEVHHHESGKSPELVLAAAVVLGSMLISLAIIFASSGISSQFEKIAATGIIAGAAVPGGSQQADSEAGGNEDTGADAQLPPQGALTKEQMKALVPKAAATLGNPDAPVIMFEFSDYQCLFCRRHFNDVYPKIKENYIDTGKVLFAFYDFPWASAHPMAIPSAKAARCAGEQGLYWEAHDALYEGQNPSGTGTVAYTEEQLKAWVLAVPGIDAGEFNSCYSSTRHDAAINENLQLGTSIGVQGTPGFRINGKEISGAYPYETFEAAIKAGLAS